MDSSITPAYKNVEIITIGDEIINGQIVDSNSAWIASFLNRSGFEVDKITSVPDDAQSIFRAVDSALGSSPIVLLTGGLGPTKDDITKHCLCSYFKTKLVFNQAVYDNMTGLFNKRGLRRINDFNRSQAEVPEACTVIVNRKGTAPVTWFEREGKILVSMPGVPLEMMWCMEKEIMPRLLNKVQSHPILQRYIWVKGYPEAVLAEFISDWEDALPPELKLAYLPQRSVMLLRLTAKNNDETTLIGLLETQLAGLRSRLGSAIFAEGVKTLEEALGQVLIKKGLKLALAESCTGGAVGARLTRAPGSSAYFLGGIISYANELKQQWLGVPETLLQTKGAVSKEVAEAMAAGARIKLKSDIGIALSGIAGPTGGSAEKPVGTVFIALADNDRCLSRKFEFQSDRLGNIEQSVHQALILLLDYLYL